MVALCAAAGEDGEHDVEHDDGGEACPAQDDEQDDAGQEERVADAVGGPAVGGELQGEHGDFGHEQVAREGGEHHDDVEPVGRGCQRVAAAHGEGAPEEGIGRGGEADEGVGLARVEVELGQPQGRERGDEEGQVGDDEAGGRAGEGQFRFAEEGKGHCGGRHAERDVVGQRIELLADGRGHVEQPCGKAVEEVEHRARDDGGHRGSKAALQGENRGHAPAEQVAAGQRVGDMAFQAGHEGWSLAMTVWLPVVACPSFTLTSAVSGRKTSTREPNLMKPRCSSM